jgi:chemotaxis protein MotA
MNIFSIVGLIISTAVLLVGLKLSSDNLMIFLDGPSLFIVIGGTFAAASIAFQLNKIGALLKIFIKQFLGGRLYDKAKIIRNIMQLCEGARGGDNWESLAGKAEDDFLREGMELLADGVLDTQGTINIMRKRSKEQANLHLEDTRKIKALGKFPPAFGMMGTTIGMIVLLANLGGADAMKTIGPAMGVCLITTLYGVIIANLVFIPIAENLEGISIQVESKNKIIIEGVKHIINKSNPILVAEDLNSFLPSKERLDWKSL